MDKTEYKKTYYEKWIKKIKIESVEEIVQDLVNNERNVVERRIQNTIPNQEPVYEQPQQPQTFIEQPTVVVQTQSIPKIEVDRYDDIIATKIVTLPNVESGAYFVDSSNIGEITTQGDLFYLTPTIENLSNPNLNYVVPMGLTKDYDKSHYYILNSTNDFFLLDIDTKINTFINLSYIEESIKKSFVEKSLNHAKKAFIVLMKNVKNCKLLIGVFPGANRLTPVSVLKLQLLCLPEPFTPAKGFSCISTLKLWRSATFCITSISNEL